MDSKTIDFSHEDRQLQVKVVSDSEGWRIRVFEDDKPVTGIVYNISHETSIDARMQGVPVDLVEGLMQTARTDVELGHVPLV